MRNIFWFLWIHLFHFSYGQCSSGQLVGETSTVPNLNTGSSQGTNILLNSDDGLFTISCCGQVESWTLDAGNTGSLQLQIWRRDAEVGTWTLIGGNDVTVSAIGEQTHDVSSSDRIAVRGNDVIGRCSWVYNSGWSRANSVNREEILGKFARVQPELYTHEHQNSQPGDEIIRYRNQAPTNRNYYEMTNESSIGVGETYDWDSEIKQEDRRYVLYATLGPGNSPTFENLPSYSSIPEDATSGTSIMQISTRDVDGDNVTITMTTGTSMFEFYSENGTVSTLGSLAEGFHTLDFQAMDTCGNSNTSTLTVWVYKESSFELDENQPVGTNVGQLIQPDSLTVNYTIAGSVSDFAVDELTGLLSTLVELDYESTPLYNLQVEIAFSSPTFTATTNVTISVLNLNEFDPQFDNSTLSGSVIETASIGTSVLQISAFDVDTNINSTCNYTMLEPSNNNATAYFDLDLVTGVLTVKAGLDRETINHFEFEVEALEGGYPARSSNTMISVRIWDYNDFNPVMSSSFYDGATSNSDFCDDAIVTILATDNDNNKNARMSYYLVQSDDSYLFRMNETTGELSSVVSLSKSKYVVEGKARDNGNIELHSTGSSTIRIDTFNPSDVILSFYMDISRDTYMSNEDTFLRGLESDVFSSSYPSAQVRRWCIQENTTDSIIVHVYVLDSNTTGSITNIGVDKVFINNTDAVRYVATDESGTLSAKITGNSWSVFNLQKVLMYTTVTTTTTTTTSVDITTSSLPWIQTTEGIAVIAACATVGLLLIVITGSCIAIAITRCRKKSPELTDPGKMGKGEVPHQKTPRTTPIPLMDVPPPYYRADRHRALIPMPYNRSMFSKPRTIQNHGKQSSVPIGTPRQTPETGLPSVENDDKSSAGDGSYIFKNRKFDGRVYEKGHIMQYDTKSNSRDWIKTPEGSPTAFQ